MNRYYYSIAPEFLDSDGLATIPSIYKIIINSIGLNIRKEGYGIDVLSSKGLTWALARCAMEFTSRPTLYTDINIDVWKSESNSLCHDRCIMVTDNSGKEICRGITDWCVIDISSRKPYPLVCSGDDYGPLPCKTARRLHPFKSPTKKAREVGYSECDFNGHLNNCRYVEMFYDMLPAKAIGAMEKFRLDINFKREIPLGSLTEAYITGNDLEGYDYCMYYDGNIACCASITNI